MWIKNYSADDVKLGSHDCPGPNSILIQIVDVSDDFPKPAYPFKEIYQFQFGDLEDHDDADESRKFSDHQAKTIIDILNHAIEQQMNVIVHCLVGVCRSGAVVEVGVMMGFEDSLRWRSPNLRVKHKLMKQLGYYNYE